jgi:AraC-like DNA-binding protein
MPISCNTGKLAIMPEPSFDNWTIIFLFFALLSFLIAIFLFVRKVPGKRANCLLGFYLLAYGISMVEYVLYWTGYARYVVFMNGISISFPFVYGPLLLMYLAAVYGNKPSIGTVVRHLVIFILFFVFTSLLIHWTAFSHTLFTQAGMAEYSNTVYWLGIVHMAAYGAYSLLYVRQQGSAGGVKKWARWMVTFFILFLSSHIAYQLLVRMPFFNSQWDYFISFIMSAGIVGIAWFGYAHPAIFQGFSIGQSITSPSTVYMAEQLNAENELLTADTPGQYSPPGIKYKNSGLTAATAKKITEKLAALMEKEKVYRENDISLDKLATLLNISRHQLSQVINEHYKVNFFEFINLLRIEEAKLLLAGKTKQELNAIEVAYLVGFNNKVSFTNAFKKATGLTPARYRQEKS